MTQTDLAVLRVLVLEPPANPNLSRLLPTERIQVSTVVSGHSTYIPEHVDSLAPDAVVAPICTIPSASVLEAVRMCPDTPFVVVAPDSFDGEELVREGVEEVLPRSALTSERLTTAIAYAVARRRRKTADDSRQTPALGQTDPRFRALAEASPAAVFIAQNGRITYANQMLAALTGRRRRDLIGMDPFDLVDPADRPGAEARSAASVRGDGAEGPVEVRIVTRSGEECWVDITMAQIVYDGGAAVVGTGIDVTARKRLELRMQQGQRLEAIGRLAGGVAHDFNNLLMVIGGETERLLDALPPSSPLRGSVESIARAADRAASLTEQLLAFGRRQMLIARPVDVNDVVAELHEMLGDHRIGTTLHLAADLPPVQVDRIRLAQVLVNLVANARDAMGQQGFLTISTDLVQADEAMRDGRPWLRGGTWVRLQVSDTGPGIPVDVMPHVFEPFFSTKRGGPATGLGLSTVYGIVKQSEGFVWIDSEPGAGARVTILLPPAHSVPAERRADSEPVAAAARILLVEDEDAVRKLLGDVLQRNGFTVTSAASAEEALGRAGDSGFDLLLTDVVLPGINGPELARRIRANAPATRVLFMSGYTGGSVVDPTEFGDDPAFIQKPFGAPALMARIRALLRT